MAAHTRPSQFRSIPGLLSCQGYVFQVLSRQGYFVQENITSLVYFSPILSHKGYLFRKNCHSQTLGVSFTTNMTDTYPITGTIFRRKIP